MEYTAKKLQDEKTAREEKAKRDYKLRRLWLRKMKTDHKIGDFLSEEERRTTADVLLSSSVDFREGILSGRSINRCQVVAITECYHKDGQRCKQIQHLDNEDIPPSAKGLIFLGPEDDEDTRGWHCCTKEIRVFQPPAFTKLDEMEGLDEKEYDDLAENDQFDMFPTDEDILTNEFA
ncbi:MAG: hypothetical protein CMH98_04865 [Oceanospirillaceae bacterium]|nr:hypothetical protein [Oceanospirillaceae bacterium]